MINDCFSPIQGQWGSSVKKLLDLEHLTLFAETTDGYLEILSKEGFLKISVDDVTKEHAKYNQDVVEKLKTLPTEKKLELVNKFGINFTKDAITGYEAIVNAMQTRELLVQTIRANKPF